MIYGLGHLYTATMGAICGLAIDIVSKGSDLAAGVARLIIGGYGALALGEALRGKTYPPREGLPQPAQQQQAPAPGKQAPATDPQAPAADPQAPAAGRQANRGALNRGVGRGRGGRAGFIIVSSSTDINI